MARLAISPMISRIVMLPPYDQKCDDEYDCAEKHTAQQGAKCFGYGHGIGEVGHLSCSTLYQREHTMNPPDTTSLY
jgi:hypothetical protein